MARAAEAANSSWIERLMARIVGPES
jgi:hypothetical protein